MGDEYGHLKTDLGLLVLLLVQGVDVEGLLTNDLGLREHMKKGR